VESGLRSRFCESLAAVLPVAPFDRFLAGMFSMLNAILGSTMERVVVDLPVSDEIRAALLDRSAAAGQALQLIETFERAEWTRVDGLAAALGGARRRAGGRRAP
jgi:c-di-GMP phosphodiesterase